MNRHTHTTWTEDRRRIVAKLLRDGKSASEIGTHLGVSRNAVIGIVKRDPILRDIGFERSRGANQRSRSVVHLRREEGIATPAFAKRRCQKKLLSSKNPPPSDATTLPACHFPDTEPAPLGLTLNALSPKQCRFGVNSPGPEEEHLFCGLPVRYGSRYCEHHHCRVFVTRTRPS